VKLFLDENLSPRLVAIGHARGYDTTCARDRALLGSVDRDVLELCVNEDRVIVTNDADDFRGLVGELDVHPGLIVLPLVDRATQADLLERRRWISSRRVLPRRIRRLATSWSTA